MFVPFQETRPNNTITSVFNEEHSNSLGWCGLFGFFVLFCFLNRLSVLC